MNRKTETKPKTKKAKPPRVYWLRVEIDPDYEWDDELMEDVAAEARCYIHVERAEFVTNDTLLALIEGALQSAVAEEAAGASACTEEVRSASRADGNKNKKKRKAEKNMIVSSLYSFEPGKVFYRIEGTHDIRTLIMIRANDIEYGQFIDITDQFQSSYDIIRAKRNELFTQKEDAVLEACRNLEREIFNLKNENKLK